MIEQFMMRYLRKRGWIVFWLDECARECKDTCWLKLYMDEENRNREGMRSDG